MFPRVCAALGAAVRGGGRGAAARQAAAASTAGASALPRHRAAPRGGGQVRAQGRTGTLHIVMLDCVRNLLGPYSCPNEKFNQYRLLKPK